LAGEVEIEASEQVTAIIATGREVKKRLAIF